MGIYCKTTFANLVKEFVCVHCTSLYIISQSLPLPQRKNHDLTHEFIKNYL